VSERSIEPPSLANGRYQVVGALGAGSQGETLEAIDKREGRLVAIKRFRIRGAGSWKAVELAEREARVLARLQHPALPLYLDHFEEQGALYLVMGKVEGTNLAQYLATGRRFDQNDVVRLLRAASDVLDYLHTQSPPVIHRDLKPGNVVIRPDQSFAFVDFGCVRDSLKPEGGSTVVGTFGYMAPEQFQGRALPTSDVYAIGATALTMLTGREPEQLPHRGLAIDVERTLRGVAAPQLVRVLKRMLTPDPDERASRIAPLLASLPAGVRSTRTEWEAERQSPPDRSRANPARTSRRRVRRRTARQRSAERPLDLEFDHLGENVREEVRRAWREIRQELFGPGQAHRSHRPGAKRRGGKAGTRDGAASSLPVACATAGIALARLVTWAVFALAVPVILSLLAVFSRQPWKRASAQAARIQGLIDAQLRKAHDQVESGGAWATQTPRMRVESTPSKVRLDADESDFIDDADDPSEQAVRRPSVQRRGL
jgi:serine/threonine protein kinase